jgi:hypothetical protein
MFFSWDYKKVTTPDITCKSKDAMKKCLQIIRKKPINYCSLTG